VGQEKGTTTSMVSGQKGSGNFSGKDREYTFGLHGAAKKCKFVVFSA